jgi:hypothetical protein
VQRLYGIALRTENFPFDVSHGKLFMSTISLSEVVNRS